jgi:hypothetical protein
MKNSENKSRTAFNQTFPSTSQSNYTANQVKAGIYALFIERDTGRTDHTYANFARERRKLCTGLNGLIKRNMTEQGIKNLFIGKMPESSANQLTQKVLENIAKMTPTIVETYSALFYRAGEMLSKENINNNQSRNPSQPYTAGPKF